MRNVVTCHSAADPGKSSAGFYEMSVAGVNVGLFVALDADGWRLSAASDSPAYAPLSRSGLLDVPFERLRDATAAVQTAFHADRGQGWMPAAAQMTRRADGTREFCARAGCGTPLTGVVTRDGSWWVALLDDVYLIGRGRTLDAALREAAWSATQFELT